MKRKVMTTGLTLLLITTAGFAQGRKQLTQLEKTEFLVSSRAGWVNIVQGDVVLKRDEADWDMMIAGDELVTGDTVKTGSDGRAELLLNPGSYLRLSTNAEAVFTNTSLDDLAVKLVRGSAIVEAVSVDGWTGALVKMSTPGGEVSIVRGGLYRFNVDGSGRSEVFVRKGRLVIDGNPPITVKEGKKAVLGGTPVVVAFDRKAEDEFDLWSKVRAETLAAANKTLSRRSLLGFGLMPGSFWFFDPFLRCYTFLPGFWGFKSPYGPRYSSCNRSYDLWGGRYPRGTVNGGSPTTSSGGWSRGNETIARPAPTAPRSSAPRSTGPSNSGGGWTRGGGGTVTRPSGNSSSKN
jgi:hypothetical protein